MNDVTHRLVLAYRRQLELYGEVLDLSRESASSARAGRPLDEIKRLQEMKQQRLSEIEAVDRAVRLDKQTWLESGRPLGGTDLDALLRQLTDRIEMILRAEREAEMSIIAASGVDTPVAMGGLA